MAISFYNNLSNYDTNYSPLFRPSSPSPELFAFHEDSIVYDSGVNPLFEYNYNYNNYSNILPPIAQFAPTGNVFVPSPEFHDASFSYQDYPSINLPYSNTFDNEKLFPPPVTYQGDGYQGQSQLWIMNPLYDQIEESNSVQVKKRNEGGNGGGSLSTQSMAARVRRRKISDKTQELGKLIPGGHKMNTAEMFQAAYKYIKFLQAQIGVLEHMASLPESEEVMGNGEMQALVTCTLMQEKLYTEEKCIGPECIAETMAIKSSLT